MLGWKLNEVMTAYGIKATALARVMGISNTAISNYRRAKELPCIGSVRITSLVLGLRKLSGNEEIRFSDLYEEKISGSIIREEEKRSEK